MTESNYQKKFAARILELRKGRKISQQYVADKIGIKVGTYQNYELSRREASYEIINKLADLYMVSLDYLFMRDGAEKIDPVSQLTESEMEKSLIEGYFRLDKEKRLIFVQQLANIALGIKEDYKTEDKESKDIIAECIDDIAKKDGNELSSAG